MRLIITGASGFIGTNLVLGIPSDWDVVACYHNAAGFPGFIKSRRLEGVRPIGVDLTMPGTFEEAFEGLPTEYDACVYLAANGDPAISAVEPLLDISQTTCTLINFLERFHVKRFVYMSSGAVYDGLKGAVCPDLKINPLLPYSISNQAAEQYVKFYALRKGAVEEYIILRFFGAYGPYEPERKIYTRLTRAFGMEGKSTFSIRGNGENLIDAMYIGDAVEALLTVVRSEVRDMTLDFCSGTPLTVNELVLEAARVFGVENARIVHEGSVPEYIQFRPSPREMAETFGFKPKTPLDVGLRRLHGFLTARRES